MQGFALSEGKSLHLLSEAEIEYAAGVMRVH
eukprot:COSAG05_NODE_711_length_7822_cov_11.919720_3_plen_31_part_00